MSEVASYTKLTLAFLSDNLCPLCKNKIVKETSYGPRYFAQAAHIYGNNPGSARYISDMTDDERNHINNLVYICNNCHAVLDADPDAFSADQLLRAKKEHEEAVKERRERQIESFTFDALDRVAKWIRYKDDQPFSFREDWNLMEIGEKIKKNNLSDEVKSQIIQLIAHTTKVGEYITSEEKKDPMLSEELVAGFRKRYYDFFTQGKRGDELFIAMTNFSCDYEGRTNDHFAYFAVLIYLFERCEVFEK